MLVLVIDTATPAITAAVAEISPGGVWIRAERVTVGGKAHGERLAPQIDAALAEAGAKARDLAAIVAGLGPGPFTGLRVGLMTAASIGDALGIPTYGVCSLDALGATTTGTALVATDARRREVYWAVYADGERIDGPHVDKPADVANTVAGPRSEQIVVGPGVEQALAGTRSNQQAGRWAGPGGAAARAVGEGALKYADQLGLPIPPEAPVFPPALELARLAAPRVLEAAASEPLTPLYLRRPDTAEPRAPKRVS